MDALHDGHLRNLAVSIRSQLQWHKRQLRAGVNHEADRQAAREFCRFILNSSVLDFVSLFVPQDDFERTCGADVLRGELRELLLRVSGNNRFEDRKPVDLDARLSAIDENLSILAGHVSRLTNDGRIRISIEPGEAPARKR